MDYTTELTAVNAMLATIGEAPINSLSDVQVVDAITARAALQEVTRAVLVEGWAFNTDVNFPFMPEGFAPFEIRLPSNAMSVIPTSEFRHVVARGARLYNTETHSFSFEGSVPVTCEVVWHLTFDELPEVTRQYVAIRAARLFQARTVASDLLHAITEGEERQARWSHRKNNTRVRRKRYLSDSAMISTILHNR